MFDFRLKVFQTVANRLNFTKAAQELYISQPAITRHIHELEKYFNIKLFERNGTKIALTHAGNVLLQHAERIFGLHRDMERDMAALSNHSGGTLTIGASTTIAQYILPGILAMFHKNYASVKSELSVNNTEQIEKALETGSIDLGVVEGQSKNINFKYIPFVKDELVLVVRFGHPLALTNEITIDDLRQQPLLVREPGSGTLEVLLHALKDAGVKFSSLNVEMQLAGTEAIKQYILASNAAAFLSVHSITQELKNKMLSVVDIKDMAIERQLFFIKKQGEENRLIDLFIDFAHRDNIRL